MGGVGGGMPDITKTKSLVKLDFELKLNLKSYRPNISVSSSQLSTPVSGLT